MMTSESNSGKAGTRRGRGRPPAVDRLPAAVRAQIVDRLNAGQSIAAIYREMGGAATFDMSARTFQAKFGPLKQSLQSKREPDGRGGVDAFAANTLQTWRTRESWDFVGAALLKMVALHFGVRIPAPGAPA